jgi:hypothetical protein
MLTVRLRSTIMHRKALHVIASHRYRWITACPDRIGARANGATLMHSNSTLVRSNALGGSGRWIFTTNPINMVRTTLLALAVSSFTTGQAQLILTGNNLSLEYPGNGTAIPANVPDANGWYYVNGPGQNGFASPQVGYVKRQTCGGQPVNATYSFASNVNYPGNCSSTAQHGEVHDVFGGVPVGCQGNDKYIMMRGQGTSASSEMIGVVHNLDQPVTAGQMVVFRGWLGYKRGIPATLGTTSFQFYMALGNTTDPPVTLPTPPANTVGLLSGTIPTSNCMTWVQPLASIVAPQNFNRVILYVRTSAPAGARNHFYLDDLAIATADLQVLDPQADKEEYERMLKSSKPAMEILTTEEMTAWPVPAVDEVAVGLPWENTAGGQLSMFDGLGREVWTSTVTSDRMVIPMAQRSPGTYVVKYVSGERTALVRVQKE